MQRGNAYQSDSAVLSYRFILFLTTLRPNTCVLTLISPGGGGGAGLGGGGGGVILAQGKFKFRLFLSGLWYEPETL